jgi:HTH-type transcriptional regulator/antitoxin HigA
MLPGMSEQHPVIAPGKFVEQQLALRGWTQKTLATVIEASPQVVSQLISGRRRMDAEMAIVLGEAFGLPAVQFLETQSTYDLAVAGLSVRPDPARARRAWLYSTLPVAEAIKRRWIEATDVTDVRRVEDGFARFFGVQSPEHIPILPAVYMKTGAEPVSAVELVWLYRVRQLAGAIPVSTYSTASLRDAIKEMRTWLTDPAEVARVPERLERCGVRFVIVEPLTAAKIDGVCFWMGDTPVIGMSLRANRNDNFWFVLRHEIEHVLREHGRHNPMEETAVDGEIERAEGAIPEQEQEANDAAKDFCVPSDEMQDFYSRKRPFFTDTDIIKFARRMKVHPGLVAGQLRRRTGKWDHYSNHLVPIRSTVVSNARTDGWGIAAPIIDNGARHE